MIVRICDPFLNNVIVSYPNLKDKPLSPDYEKQLCDYVWKDAVSSQLVIEGEREYYRFEFIEHPTKQKINA